MTKKQKTVLIAVLSIIAVLIVAGTVVALVLLLPEDNPPSSYPMPSMKMQYEYYIDADDNSGIILKDAFREQVPLSALTRKDNVKCEGLDLSNELKLTLTDQAEIGDKAEYEFSYKDRIIAVIKVNVIDATSYIYTADELLSLSGEGVYILNNPIDLSGKNGRIARFIGKLHCNHNAISGFDCSGGALFGELDGAMVTGLDMVGVKGTINVSDFGNFGVIANVSDNTALRYSSVQGDVTLNSSAEEDDIVYVGGLLGYVSASARRDYSTIAPQVIGCTSFISLTVNGSGDLRVGGISGGVRNATIRESVSCATINVKVTEVQVANFKGLYVGGIAGALSKDYDTVVEAYNLDEGARIYSYANIGVDIAGGGTYNDVYVGGIYGSLTNHSLVNLQFNGKIDVKLTRCSLNLGGIVGKAQNTTDLNMAIRGIGVKGEINVYSLSNVWAGGIAGSTEACTYSSVTESITPVVTNDKSLVQGTQTASAAVASIN
ncbi:MAG: hypothetical protein J6V83_05920 [Clostridia bacterium]|nr:hypothetical protein [Clostridia bacterium]